MTFVILSAFVVFAVIAGVCCTRAPEKVKIAYIPFSADLPYFVALEKGYFKEEGLEIEPIKSANSNEMMNALLAGQVDAIAPVGFSTIFSVEAASPGQIKIYLPGGETEGHIVSHLIVKKDSPFRNIQDLKGKRIGTYTGSTQLMNLRLFLEKAGFSPDKDFIIMQVSSDLQIQALEAGQFDALFSVEPFTTNAIAKNIARSMIDNPRSKYIVDPFVSGAAVMTMKNLKDRPELSEKIFRAMLRGANFVRSNEAEAKQYLIKYTTTEETVALNSDTYAWFELDQKTKDAIQKLADLYLEFKIIPVKLDLERMYLTESDFALK
jgi:NitT/TauT family transport system substrate-binding protein